MTERYKFEPLQFAGLTEAQMEENSAQFLKTMRRRRTVRDFADTPVPQSVIENAIATAATAPSGANMQPWHFVAIKDADIKKQIRLAAEEEERALYHGRASDEWLVVRPTNILGFRASERFHT